MENESLDMKDDYTGNPCTIFEIFLKSKIISNEKNIHVYLLLWFLGLNFAPGETEVEDPWAAFEFLSNSWPNAPQDTESLTCSHAGAYIILFGESIRSLPLGTWIDYIYLISRLENFKDLWALQVPLWRVKYS